MKKETVFPIWYIFWSKESPGKLGAGDEDGVKSNGNQMFLWLEVEMKISKMVWLILLQLIRRDW